MTAKMLVGSLPSSLRRGSPKAAVFPEPVSELMMTLLPWRMCGMVSAWMGVGVLYLIFSQVLNTQLDNLSLLNEVINDYNMIRSRTILDKMEVFILNK
jgi:hypothetical protein